MGDAVAAKKALDKQLAKGTQLMQHMPPYLNTDEY
jgi:hypothetical protein